MSITRVLSLCLVLAVGGCTSVQRASTEQRLGVRAGSAVPEWANELAGPLPATARAMLRLDHRQRAHNPLGSTLAARLRLAAAEELRCEPVALAASADLAASGEQAATPGDQLAVDFARHATRAAHRLDDDAFAGLLAAFGVEQTVAIVHTVAYAGFLCRIVHGLGVSGALPLGALPDPAVPLPGAPARARPGSAAAETAPGALSWSEADWEELQGRQRAQQAHAPRVPLPEAQRLLALEQKERDAASRIVWSRVGYGYQPELTRDWFQCLYAFRAEARPDEVFANALFWVVTRTNDCFY